MAIPISIQQANIKDIVLFSFVFWACFSCEARDIVTAVELESAQRNAEIGIQPFAQINFDKKYQTNQIQDINSTKSHTLNKLMSESIAYKSHDSLSSNLVHINNSDTALFGITGKIAPEKTRSCSEANHSFIFKELANLFILALNVLTQAIIMVKIMAITSNQNQISTQIKKTSNAHSSAVIQYLFSLKAHEIWEIDISTKTDINEIGTM